MRFHFVLKRVKIFCHTLTNLTFESLSRVLKTLSNILHIVQRILNLKVKTTNLLSWFQQFVIRILLDKLSSEIRFGQIRFWNPTCVLSWSRKNCVLISLRNNKNRQYGHHRNRAMAISLHIVLVVVFVVLAFVFVLIMFWYCVGHGVDVV